MIRLGDTVICPAPHKHSVGQLASPGRLEVGQRAVGSTSVRSRGIWNFIKLENLCGGNN